MSYVRIEIVRWDKPQMNHFIAMPRIALDELTTKEFKLYAYYIDQTQWRSSIQNGVVGVSEACKGIAKNGVGDLRRSLRDKGYIDLVKGINPDDADIVTLKYEIWERNAKKYNGVAAQIERAVDVIEAIGVEALPDDQAMRLYQFLVSRFQDTGVPIPVQPVPDSGHGRTDSGTESYIEEKEEDSDSIFDGSTVDGEGKKNTTVPQRCQTKYGYQPGSLSELTDEEKASISGKHKNAALKSKTPQANQLDISEHPLVVLFKSQLNVSKLDQDMRMILTSRFNVYGEEDEILETHQGGLIGFYDAHIDFQAFCTERLTQIGAAGNWQPINALKHLRKFTRPASENGGLYGYYKWLERQGSSEPFEAAMADTVTHSGYVPDSSDTDAVIAAMFGQL